MRSNLRRDVRFYDRWSLVLRKGKGEFGTSYNDDPEILAFIFRLALTVEYVNLLLYSSIIVRSVSRAYTARRASSFPTSRVGGCELLWTSRNARRTSTSDWHLAVINKTTFCIPLRDLRCTKLNLWALFFTSRCTDKVTKWKFDDRHRRRQNREIIRAYAVEN